MATLGLKRVVVAGGTGLVGRALVKALLVQEAQVTVLTRHPGSALVPAGVRVRGWVGLAKELEGVDAVFNLAGEGLADQRWSPRRKALLLSSRVGPTEELVESMRACTHRPAVLVNASAIGYYGPGDDTPVCELNPAGEGFLAEICRAWEAAALPARELGVRVVLARLGVVLAREGGALPKMARPVRLCLGSRLGNGQQGLSWIHLHDLESLLLEAARNPAWEGPFNATAPEPVSQNTFVRLLARQLHRPLLPLPGWLTSASLRLLLGDMGQELLLEGAYVHPMRAEALGFPFRFNTPEEALEDLL
jgi:uncharacterized protein